MAHEIITYEPHESQEEAGIYQLCRLADAPLVDSLHESVRNSVLQSIEEEWDRMLKS